MRNYHYLFVVRFRENLVPDGGKLDGAAVLPAGIGPRRAWRAARAGGRGAARAAAGEIEERLGNDWLDQGLDALRDGGEGALTIDGAPREARANADLSVEGARSLGLALDRALELLAKDEPVARAPGATVARPPGATRRRRAT
ncbi:hypothetical protein [Sorangium sp. So ce1000]|uniref:hypothetical protein n=1 Tax=Sorangium sp. So ce1000 TaxID=3133325 RepID=UPI003F62D530